MAILKYPALLLMFLLISGCSAFIKEPTVILKQTSLVSIDTSGAELEFLLAVNNPNSFDLTLLGYTYDLNIMTLPLAAGGLQQTMQMKGGSESDFRIPVRVKYADVIEILKRRPDPDKIPYHLNARLHLQTFAGEMTVPVNSSGTVALPEKYRPSAYIEMLRGFFR